MRLSPRVTLAAVVSSLALMLAGCGGGSAIPKDASIKDFCKAGQTFAGATRFSDGVKAANTLHDTGTPKGIAADARAGFELVVSLVKDSKDKNDLLKRYDKLSDSEKKSVASLDAYIKKTC